MAAVTLLGSATFDTSSGTKQVTATPAVDDLIVIITAHSANSSSAEPTDNQGGTYVLITSAAKATSADVMRLWVRRSKITAASSTVFTHAPGTSTGGGLAVLKVTGMSRVGIAAIRQSAVQQNQSAATPAPVFGTAALTGNACVGACYNATNPATLTQRTSWTERVDAGHASTTQGLHVMSRDSGETGTTQTWGSASGSAFSSLVAELNTAAADPVEESEYGGTHGNFAGVAIAGLAAAALATSVAIAGGFNFNDEIGATAADRGFGGTSAAAPAPDQAPRLLYWHQGDELPYTAPAPALSDDEWQPAPLQAAPRPTLVWVADDLPVAAPALTEGEWQAPSVTSTAPPRLVWLADDLPATAAPSIALHEGEWQPPFAIATRPVPLASWDDAALPRLVPLDEQAWQAPWVITPTVTPLVWITGDELGTEAAPSVGGGGLLHDPVRLIRWYQDDSVPIAATPLPVELEYWQRPPVQPAVRDLRLWTSTDERETVPAALQVGADDSAAPLRTRPADATSVVWAENDDFPQQGAATRFEDDAFTPAPKIAGVNGIVWAIDDDLPRQPWVPREEYWHRVYSIRVEPVLRVWLQQDERETAATPLPVDENEWARPFSITPPRDLRLWATTDDIEQTPAPLQVVDDDHWLPYAIPVPPRHTLWQADEPIVPVVATLAVEDYWQAPFTVRVLPIAWVGTHQDGRETIPPPLPVEDEYWQKPPHITLPLDLRLWSGDEPVVPYVEPTVTHGRRGQPIKDNRGRSFTYAVRSSNTSKTRRK
jgi:hypothetical protein